MKKSTFYCSAIPVKNLTQVEAFLDYIHMDPHTSDATHSIAAWICGDDSGFDEDGEHGAGTKLFFML